SRDRSQRSASTLSEVPSRPQPAAALAARLRDDLWLAAAPTQAWVSRTPPDRSEILGEASVRSLLDGALSTAIQLHSPRLPPSPPLTPLRWIWRLVGYYHLTHSTTALLELAAQRFAAAGQPALAGWASERAREEDKH